MDRQPGPGHVDDILGANITGWALDPIDTEMPAVVDIFLDERRIASVTACTYREDLHTLSIREGFAGFGYRIPAQFCDDKAHVVSCRLAYSGQELTNSPIPFRHDANPARVALTRMKQVFAKSFAETDLASSIRQTRKVAIVSTYHEWNVFLEYQKTMFKTLAEAGFTCLIVHSCNNFDARLTIEGKSQFLIARRNVGYDFGSYATGHAAVLRYVRDVDEILFINDSIIQTSQDLGSLLARVRALGSDMVGITDSFERSYHLQSYFVWTGKRIVQSSFLANFFATYALDGGRTLAIQDGELTMTSCALSEGFDVKALCDYESVAATWLDQQDKNRKALNRILSRSSDSTQRRSVIEQFENTIDLILRGVPLNPSHFFWDTLLTEFHVPFVKREFLLKNPAEIASYVRLSEVLSAFPAAQNAIAEARRRYGGERVPLLRREHDLSRSSGDLVSHREIQDIERRVVGLPVEFLQQRA